MISMVPILLHCSTYSKYSRPPWDKGGSVQMFATVTGHVTYNMYKQHAFGSELHEKNRLCKEKRRSLRIQIKCPKPILLMLL